MTPCNTTESSPTDIFNEEDDTSLTDETIEQISEVIDRILQITDQQDENEELLENLCERLKILEQTLHNLEKGSLRTTVPGQSALEIQRNTVQVIARRVIPGASVYLLFFYHKFSLCCWKIFLDHLEEMKVQEVVRL